MSSTGKASSITRRSFIIAASLGVAGGLCGVFAPGGGHTQDAIALGLEGQNLLEAGKPHQAVTALGRALALAPDDTWLQGLLGRAYLAAGEEARAAEVFAEAAEDASPGSDEARLLASFAGGGATPTPLAPMDPMARLEDAARRELAAFDAHAMRPRFKRIVLDPGHGGFDPGAVGPDGLQEKDVVLDVARRAACALEQAFPESSIVLTRTDDYFVPLSARTAMANQHAADLFISCHANAAERRGAHGVETYHCAAQASSRHAARVAAMENAALALEDDWPPRAGRGVNLEILLSAYVNRCAWEDAAVASRAFQKALVERLAMRDRGVHAANFHVLRTARMPAVLLETGFVSNREEAARLRRAETRNAAAEAVVEGVRDLRRTLA